MLVECVAQNATILACFDQWFASRSGHWVEHSLLHHAGAYYSLPLSQVILKLLSEEVFDFSRGELTQAKTKELKTSLNADFRLIHELSLWVLNAGARPDLTR